MIGLDTNVLVRYIMQDDPKQSRQATALIESLTEDAPGFVALVAVVELAWVLESAYSLTRAQVADAIAHLTEVAVFKVERVAIVASAWRTFRDGTADFADCLIERSGAASGCDCTMTFDRAAVKTAGMVLVK
jgi:predicted nucleic-acid-binding protein